MWPYIKLIRPKHWVKNLFLFIPTFFAGNAFETPHFKPLLLGFLSFSLVASSIYILNDLMDKDVDRLHSTKKFRPIASGDANTYTSVALMFAMCLSGLLIAWLSNSTLFIIIAVYTLINIAYSCGLKLISIVDILIVASGFLFRIYAGGVLSEIKISHWLAIMIFLLSLFLTLAKRRDDLILSKHGEVIRKASRKYNLEFINACLSLFAGIIIVSYIMYTLSPEISQRWNSEWLFATTFFVIAGLLRYLQITFVEDQSGSPTSILFKDRFIIVTLIGWILSFYLIIYM